MSPKSQKSQASSQTVFSTWDFRDLGLETKEL